MTTVYISLERADGVMREEGWVLIFVLKTIENSFFNLMGDCKRTVKQGAEDSLLTYYKAKK